MRFRYRLGGWLFRGLVAAVVAVLLDRRIWPGGHDALIVAGRFGLQLGFAMLFMVAQFGFLMWFLARGRQITILPGDRSLTFKDYYGQPALVKAVSGYVSTLRRDSHARLLGGKPLRGLLLFGPPGSGKTHLAKCLAGEAGVPFIGTEGASFRAMFFGVDVLKVIFLVRKARSLARRYPHNAAIVYIDEIDSIGMSRGGVMGGGAMGMMGGFSGALSTLLTQMDGLEEVGWLDRKINAVRRLFGLRPVEPPNIFFVGATNRPDVLDPALTRPGRLDKRIEVGFPDRMGRRAVVEGYMKKVKTEGVDVDALVYLAGRMSPASITQAITRDAPLRAGERGHKRITHRDIVDALIESHAGVPNPIADLNPMQREQIAYHEAGHAVATHLLMQGVSRVVYLTIVRTGMALGFMLPAEDDDLYAMSLDTIENMIEVALAGHEATKIWANGRIWTGASSDFKRVDSLVKQLAHYRAFDEMYIGGPLSKTGQEHYENQIRHSSDRVHNMLVDNWDIVDAVAQALLEKDSLDSLEFERIVDEVVRAGAE